MLKDNDIKSNICVKRHHEAFLSKIVFQIIVTIMNLFLNSCLKFNLVLYKTMPRKMCVYIYIYIYIERERERYGFIKKIVAKVLVSTQTSVNVSFKFIG